MLSNISELKVFYIACSALNEWQVTNQHKETCKIRRNHSILIQHRLYYYYIRSVHNEIFLMHFLFNFWGRHTNPKAINSVLDMINQRIWRCLKLCLTAFKHIVRSRCCRHYEGVSCSVATRHGWPNDRRAAIDRGMERMTSWRDIFAEG